MKLSSAKNVVAKWDEASMRLGEALGSLELLQELQASFIAKRNLLRDALVGATPRETKNINRVLYSGPLPGEREVQHSISCTTAMIAKRQAEVEKWQSQLAGATTMIVASGTKKAEMERRRKELVEHVEKAIEEREDLKTQPKLVRKIINGIIKGRIPMVAKDG